MCCRECCVQKSIFEVILCALGPSSGWKEVCTSIFFLLLLFIYFLIKWHFKKGSPPFISLCPQIQEKKLDLGTGKQLIVC